VKIVGSTNEYLCQFRIFLTSHAIQDLPRTLGTKGARARCKGIEGKRDSQTPSKTI